MTPASSTSTQAIITTQTTTVSPGTTAMSTSPQPITPDDTVIIEASSSEVPTATSTGMVIINSPSTIDSITSLSTSVNSTMENNNDDGEMLSATQITSPNQTLTTISPRFQTFPSSFTFSVPIAIILNNSSTEPISFEIPRITIFLNLKNDLSEPVTSINVGDNYEIEDQPDKGIKNSINNFLTENIDLSHQDMGNTFGTSTTSATTSPSMEYRSFNQQSNVYTFKNQ